MKFSPLIVLLAALAISAPAYADNGAGQPSAKEQAEDAIRKGAQDTERAIRKGAKKAEKAMRETSDKVMKSLKDMFESIPQYEMPQVNEHGDIIIRRKNPPKGGKSGPKKDGPTDT